MKQMGKKRIAAVDHRGHGDCSKLETMMADYLRHGWEMKELAVTRSLMSQSTFFVSSSPSKLTGRK
jgi:hypothetical protein